MAAYDTLSSVIQYCNVVVFPHILYIRCNVLTQLMSNWQISIWSHRIACHNENSSNKICYQQDEWLGLTAGLRVAKTEGSWYGVVCD